MGLLVLTLALVTLTGCSKTSEQEASDRSTAYKLYALDEGIGSNGEDDPALDRYRRHLRKLDRGCTETQEELGNLALNATEIVNERTTLLDPYKIIHLLEPAAAGVGTEPAACTEMFAFVGFSLLAQE